MECHAVCHVLLYVHGRQFHTFSQLAGLTKHILTASKDLPGRPPSLLSWFLGVSARCGAGVQGGVLEV
ncbi:hypothetical protein PISMIDRAFT_679018 [Pisolithus microcarpus 441]|uniref:Uncharacterized protein n=1 Tax=Pisolithus microcarpus 441 TaxID=765257 RepID=A0A0C9ZVB1_9AGAM|nr:hypothetical protein PISMIDRAFT_679018 [Pisolithus microcarpus 441]